VITGVSAGVVCLLNGGVTPGLGPRPVTHQ